MLALSCVALTSRFAVPVRAAVALTAVAPLGASAGVNVQITGTGFDPIASNNTVTLTPQGGAAVSLVADTIAVLDAASGLRRIGIRVPAGLPVGTAAVMVRNRTTNESAGGRTLQVITIALPQTNSAVRGAQTVAVRIDGSANVQFVAGRTTPMFGAGITVNSTQVLSPTSLLVTVSVTPTTSLGPRTVNIVTSTQTMQRVAGFTVTAPNQPPTITSTAVTTAAESQPYSYQVVATDPDGDPVTCRLVTFPAGMTIAGNLISWTPNGTQAGTHNVVVEAADGRGGTAQQSFQISVAAAPQLQALDLQPALVRFSAVDTTRPLTVAGVRTNGTLLDLTSAASGTTYESSNTFVARVAADGVVTSVANGTATITARNAGFSDTAVVEVEAGVTLDTLELAPASSILRAAGATQVLVLRGRFSDGSTRDLTAAAGTTYESSNVGAATVAETGIATAVANGSTTITARHDTRAATATVAVAISSGTGFLRGEAYDDSKGLPLGQVTATLLSDGGGPLATPVDVVSDERGQFSIAGRAGDAVVRISRPGFTPVDRRASIPAGSSATLFDSRLTPVDANATLISSALGGQARSQSGRATLQIPPGGLTSDQTVSLTPLSPQGLGALLPAGWSPIAAVAIAPAPMAFGLPLQLTLANAATLSPSTPLVLARYDTDLREWVDAGAATLDAGGLTVRATVDGAGQFAVLVADSAPFAPADPIPGAPLPGVDRPSIPQAGATAAGEVIPRSAPPGDDARALGRVGVTAPQPAPSGTLLQARVSERFDLLDQTQVVTQPFTQDLVTYAVPRPATGTLAATFPITPSRTFTIQQLMLGVVRLDVTPFAAADGSDVVGAGGGTVSSAEGDTLQIPAGALGANVPVSLRRVALADVGLALPAGFDAVAGLQVDMVGASFASPATLTTAATGLSAQDQVLVARAFIDPFGQRRLGLVAVGTLVNGRLVTSTVVGTLTLAGIAGGGDYVFLRAQQPVGFFTGAVTRTGGAPATGVLVSTNTAGLSAITGADGRYVVAGRAGADSTVRAANTSGDNVTATARVDTTGQVVTLNLTLAPTAPTVVAVSPAAGATNVPLDTSITIDFSEAIDAASVNDSTVVLERSGTPVAAGLSLSADGRRIVVRPAAPLAAISTFTLHLTVGLHDRSGNALTGYTPVSFITLDPSRPPQPAPGRIIAELPDESGFVLITGAPGVAAGGAVVAVINLRTQETASVLALSDGSFRVRISAAVGDELTLILRGPDGREQTIAITQFEGADGSTTVGAPGGVIHGPGGRTGTILPRALASPGTFRLAAGDAATLPGLPTGFSYADTFALSLDGAAFKALTSIALAESQNRFAPASAFAAPFAAAGELTTPPDALVSSTLRFSAVVQDADGVRRSASGSTLIAGSSPDGALAETSHTADFPTIFLTAPREAPPGQQVAVRAIAPTARVDFDLPAPAGATPTDTLLLVQHVDLQSGPALALVDRLSIDATRIRTTGRDFPGATGAGDYAVVSTREALVFVTGIVSGPQSTVTVDGLPFVFTTGGPNGRFVVAVRANAAFVLRFFDGGGAVRGTATGQAGAGGTLDVGDPLGSTAGQLNVSGEPNERSVVNIHAPLVLRFSEAIDAATIPAALVVTDDVGSRVFGRIVPAADATSVSFTPSRRWNYGTRYRYGVATSALARSGARLRAPFSASFTTFQPSVVGTLPIADARDVAVAGATAVVATAAGITTVDVSSPRAPRQVGQVAIPGGATGVSVVAAPAVTNRNGQSHTTPIALVAAGGTPAVGVLQSFDISTPTSPAALGSTQLTTASGQAPPANVPGFVGVPQSVTSTVDGQALVAIEGVGVSSVHVGQAIPLDTTVPARGAGARYPSMGAESANDVVRLGNRVLVAGVAGLTVLDATLQPVGGVSTTGHAQGVAAVPAFRMDVNGDGAVDPASEVFDLAVVANGLDGTLQFYRVPAAGDPVLLAAVRFNGAETSDVQVDAAERLAYVALGSRGLAIVDLDGPASVQPIDVDRNGVDDRVLGSVDQTGYAIRHSLDASRGLVHAAGGSLGLATMQVRPTEAKFLTLARDPVRQVSGDERSILDSAIAYTTDDRLLVTLDVLPAPSEDLLLLIHEPEGGERLLAFSNTETAALLAPGLNTREIQIRGGVTATARDVELRVTTPAGSISAIRKVQIRIPQPTSDLRELRVGPTAQVLTDDVPSVSLGVAGFYVDGEVFNVSSSNSGTRYDSSSPHVATVDPSGLVSALAGGRTTIVATNGRVSDGLSLRVQRTVTVVALRVERPHITLRALGEETTVPVLAVFSDGSLTRDVAQLPGLTFSSASPSIATASATGFIRAIGAGVVRITVALGALHASADVAVDPRTESSISTISLVRQSAPMSLDDAPLWATAFVGGFGALDGIPVTIAMTSGGLSSSTSATTDLSGSVTFRIDVGDASGTLNVVASVVDPATGSLRADSASFTISPRSADNEPNDTPPNASPITTAQTVSGTVDPTTDSRDTFVLEQFFDGRLDIDLQFLDGTTSHSVVVVLRDAQQRELSRFTPTAAAGRVSVQVPAGTTFVTVEAVSGAATYTFTARYVQADVNVGAVTPMTGAPGSLIAVSGTGFSTSLNENQVFFSGIAGEVVSATSTALVVRVPPNAVNGTVEVISGDRRRVVPGFTTGVAGTRPLAFLLPADPMARREDPRSGAVLDVTRLFIVPTLTVSRPDMDDIAARHAGQVVGHIPLTNEYVVGFPSNGTIDGLNTLRQRLRAEPLVRSVMFVTEDQPTGHPIDIFDRGGIWFDPVTNESTGVSRSQPLEQVRLGEAILLARRTPPFANRNALREVRVAVIDSGFNPLTEDEFRWGGERIFEYREYRHNQGFIEAPQRDSDDGHGTKVTSIIAAVNDGTSKLSGVLNSLVDQSERPFRVYVYGRGNDTYNVIVPLILDHIKARGDVEMDVINMSFGGHQAESVYANAIRAFRGRTLIVAGAGNEGVHRTFYPAAHQREEPHVVGAGAVASANLDRAPADAVFDERAQWVSPAGNHAHSVRCDIASTDNSPRKSSNCAANVTLAAPGEDVLALGVHGYTWDRGFDGTSAAAPIISGVAAILQAIRPTEAPLAPSIIKNLLVATATDITSWWNVTRRDQNGNPLPGLLEPMRRLNALGAVEALLSPRGSESVYITDADITGNGTGGGIVSLDVNPLTGQPLSSAGAQQVIDLRVTRSDVTVQAMRPSTTLLSRDGSRLFVYTSTDSNYGDGIFVVDTSTKSTIAFIALSGAAFPSLPGTSTPVVRADQPRPPMALTKDGRLLYVAVGVGLRIIDVDRAVIVRDFVDLPRPFNALVSGYPGDLQERLNTLRAFIALGARTGYPGTAISALALSTDGRTLHVIVETGRGSGYQPGFIVSIDVDLYTDAVPGGSLQSQLDRYLAYNDNLIPALVTSKPRSDEPTEAVASPDGRFLYVVNGGVAAFSGSTLDDAARVAYAQRVVAESTSGTLVVDIEQELAQRVARNLQNGATISIAPGVIEVFDLTAIGDTRPSPRFTSDVNHGWQPSAESGGLVLSPTGDFSALFARRPYSVSIHPGGRRAIVAYFQTGNFGVMDLDYQTRFTPPQLTAPEGAFKGVVGVTPAIPLDHHLWPTSPLDERLMFPTRVRYSQSGHLAFAIHTGVRPDAGGALSIINDDAITNDLETRAGTLVQWDGADRPYYATTPICLTPAATGASPACASSVVTNVFQYTSGGQLRAIRRPVGLAVGSTLRIAAIRHRDHLRRTSEVSLAWNSDADQLTWRVLDLGSSYGPSGSTQIFAGSTSLPAASRAWSQTFAWLARTAVNQLQAGHLYRLEFTLRLTSGLIVKDSVDVVLMN